jgi:hypothetical protein
VEVEDDRPVRREQAVELARGRSVRVLGRRLQLEEIDDVGEPQLQFRRASRRIAAAASASIVATSPQQAAPCRTRSASLL